MNRYEIDIIESNVTIQDVLSLHKVSHHGTRCRCPIHHGKGYNFSFTDKLFHCFTCGESGGVIQLEACLDGVTEDEACKILAKQFGLDISDREWTKEDKYNYMLNKRLEEDYNDYTQEKNTYYTNLSTLYRNLSDDPELAEIKSSLGDWLDDNINGVIQPWKYRDTIMRTF